MPDETPHFALDWLEEHGDRLFSYALSRVGGDAAAAEDLVQETLVAGIRAWPNFEGRSRVDTWLIGILRRKVIDRYRRDKRHASDEPAACEAGIFNEHGSLVDVVEWDAAASARLESEEFARVFDGCLAELSPQLAEAFTVCVMDGLSTDEACSFLGITPTNLSVRLHRARVALRKLLQSQWFGKET
ncbi:MAG: sigma-70 family RNA polymerase sigma factor [Planctomycetota bacterium]